MRDFDSDFNYDPDDPVDSHYFIKPDPPPQASKVPFRVAVAAYAKECERRGFEIRTISDTHSGFFMETGWSLRALDGVEVANVNGSDATLSNNPNSTGGIPCH